jgi:hypothetical protein
LETRFGAGIHATVGMAKAYGEEMFLNAGAGIHVDVGMLDSSAQWAVAAAVVAVPELLVVWLQWLLCLDHRDRPQDQGQVLHHQEEGHNLATN